MKNKSFLLFFLGAAFFAKAQNVGINNPAPQFPLSFNQSLGDKISLWADGSATHYGLGVQGGFLQIFTKNPFDRIVFGSGSSNAFAEKMRIDGNGNVGIGTNNPTASLDVARGIAGSVTANFRGTSHISHFNFGTDEHTYIRAGKNNGVVVLNDIPGGRVGIGTASPNAPLGFPISFGKKITLYPGGTGDVGIAVQAGLLQIYTDLPNTDIALGYDQGGVFTERMRVKNAGEYGMELKGRIALRNGTSPLDIAYGAGIWLYKADNTGVLGFMGVQNNQNLGFYGGPGSWGFTYDAVNSRVGIGINTPNAKLSVSADGNELAGTAMSNTFRTNAGVLGNSTGDELSLANIGFLSASNSSLGIRAYRNSTGTDWTTTALLLGYDVDNTVRAGNGFIALSANGNIGISTTAPYSPLAFNNNLGEKISFYGTALNNYGIGVVGSTLQIHSAAVGDNISFGYGSSGSFTERMRIINAGEYGMELNGRIVLKNGTIPLDLGYGAGIWLYKADNSGVLGFTGTQNNQNMGFYGGPGGWGFTYDAINSRVGIGNNNPAYPLDVMSNSPITGNFVNTATSIHRYGVVASCATTPNYGWGIAGQGGWVGVDGRAVLTGTGNRYGLFGDGANGTGENFGVYCGAVGGTGAYGIFASASGATTNWAGYFGGSVYTSGTFVTSDRSLKNEIRPLNNALSIVNKLNPSFYTFKTAEFKQMHLPEGIHYGLVADEVQQVIPGIVKKAVQPAQFENNNEHNGNKLSDKIEFNAVNYTEIIPILIGAIKEQQVIIEELKVKNQKNDQQQQQINDLLKEIQLIKEKLR